MPFILQGAKSANYLFMRRNLFLNPAANPMIAPDLLRDLRQLNAGEEDVLSNNAIKMAVFERVDLDGGAYYFDYAQVNDLRLYAEISERSIALAREHTDKITPGTAMLSFPGRGQIMETVAKLNQLGAGDAAEMMRELTTCYAGGYGCEISIDFSSMLTGDIARLRPMCCMAYLLMLDKSLLSYDTHLHLITGVLAPFYNEVDAPYRAQPLAGPVQTKKSASSLARDFLRNGRASRADLAANFSMLLGGKRIANVQNNERTFVVNILDRLLNLSFGIVHQRVNRMRTLFTYARGGNAGVVEPYVPFIPAPGANENVMFGDAPHYTDDYVAECQGIMNNLILFSEALSRRPEVGQMMPLMSHALKDVRKVSRGAAIAVESIIKSTILADCIPYRNNVRARGNVPLHTFTLPFAGALSFFMFGIESSELEDAGERFLRFRPVTSIKLPSLYPSYVFMEKAIANEVYATFAPERYHILIPKKLVSLCLEILKVYYKDVDPASERRLSLMFDEHMVFLAPPNNAERVPVQLRRGFLPDMDDPIDVVEMQNEIKYGLATTEEPGAGMPVGNLRLLTHDIYIRERRVDSVYISVDEPVPYVSHINTKGQVAALYVYKQKPPRVDTVSINDVLDQLYSTQTLTIGLGGIRQIARSMGAKYVEIDKLTTKINLVEQTGFTDEPTSEVTLTVSRKKERAERKFEIATLDVYYRLNHNEYSRDFNNIPARGMLNNMFATYIGMLHEDLMRYVVNYDGYKIDDPKLYDSDRYLRIMDGQGLIHSTQLNIATRESEVFSLETELKMRT
jgi:hypothetical protein